jgi:hypothetical protein
MGRRAEDCGLRPLLSRAEADRLEASERGRRALLGLMRHPVPRKTWRRPMPPRLSDKEVRYG